MSYVLCGVGYFCCVVQHNAFFSMLQIRRGSILIQTEIVNNPQSNIDIAVVKPLIQSKVVAAKVVFVCVCVCVCVCVRARARARACVCVWRGLDRGWQSRRECGPWISA